MDNIMTAVVWLALYALTLGVLAFALKRYKSRLRKKYGRARRRSTSNGLALVADLRARRALWFAMLDAMYTRYTNLLEAARGSRRSRKRTV